MSALACLGGIYAANPCVRVQIVAVFVWVFSEQSYNVAL